MRIVFIFLFFINFLFSNEKISLKVHFQNNINQITCQLVSYENLYKPVLDTTLASKELHFYLLKKTTRNGVYRMFISYLSNITNSPRIEYIDIIIDGLEDEIIFNFTFDSNSLPVFLVSKSNIIWYDFLNNLKERDDAFYKMKDLVLDKGLLFVSEAYKSKEEFIQKKEDEIIFFRNDFIERNDNYWAALMVNFNEKLNQVGYKTTQDVFFKTFFTLNEDLLNTPIYEAILKKYINFYLINTLRVKSINGNEITKVAEGLSSNKQIQKWIIGYLNLVLI